MADKFKFGDKVQLVKMTLKQYEENVFDENDILMYDHEVDMGDIGVVISEGEAGDYPDVAFKKGSYSRVIEVEPKDLMLHSEESEIVFLNNLMELQEKCPVQKYASLDQSLVFTKTKVEAGCQHINKADAIKIANDILTYYKVA
jgi:hypothetical protein